MLHLLGVNALPDRVPFLARVIVQKNLMEENVNIVGLKLMNILVKRQMEQVQ